MDSTIIAAIIGGTATVIAALFSWLLERNGTKGQGKEYIASSKLNRTPDEDDIYFMQYILHDGYEQSSPISTTELAVHHDGYAPLELEVKLMNLHYHGFISHENIDGTGGGSQWQMTCKGIEFMFGNNFQLQDLVNEQRKKT